MKKNRFRNFLSIILTFLMIVSNISYGILGIENVFAEGSKKNKSIESQKIKVKVRIEGPEYTILPETEVEIEKGLKNIDALKATGLDVRENYGMITSIDGTTGQPFWSINPYNSGALKEKDSVIFDGKGAMKSLSISGPSKVKDEFEVEVKDKDGKAVEDAEIKYYKASEYDYKGVNKNKIKPITTGKKTDEKGKAKIKLPSGKYFILAEKQSSIRSKALAVEVEEVSKIKVKVRIEGPEYTILPETEVEIEKGLKNIDALKATGLDVGENYGMINSIDGTSGQPFWSINPYNSGALKEKDSVIFDGKGGMKPLSISGPSKVKDEFVVEVKDKDGKAVEDAEIKYYKASEYEYKGVNKNKIKPITTGKKTDEKGKAKIKLPSGKYFILAEKQSRIRSKALSVEVEGIIEKKLKIIVPKDVTNYEQCNIIVKDEMDNPVNDVEIVYAKDKNSLVNNSDGCKKVKTNAEGKAVLNTIELKGTKCIYYQAKKEGLKSDICLLKLNIPEYTIKIDLQQNQVTVGESCKINVIVKDSNLNEVKKPDVKWESFNKTVASVDNEGNIKALKEGKAIIKVTLKNNPQYFAEKEIEIIKGKGTVHLRVEVDEGKDFLGDIDINEETSLENILKGIRGKESCYKYNPIFNDEGKLIELHNYLKGTPYYSVIINGKVIKNHRDIKIKRGDSVVCSYNGAVKELKIEQVPKECKCGKAFDVIVKDEDGNLVKEADIIIGYDINSVKNWRKYSSTDSSGRASIMIKTKRKYYIHAQSKEYIRSKNYNVEAKLPHIKLSYPKEVNNDENFTSRVTVDGTPMSDAKIYLEYKEEENGPSLRYCKLLGKSDESGKIVGKIEVPKGQYNLLVDFYNEQIRLGKITVLDKHKCQSSVISNIEEIYSDSAVVSVDDKIYLFNNKDIKCFDTKCNKLTRIGDLKENFKGEGVWVKDKVYLFGNDKVYEYNIKNSSIKNIANLPSGYRIVGKGAPIIDNKIYIYERSKTTGAIVEFDINTKKLNIIYKIDIKSWNGIFDTGTLDEAAFIQVNKKLYIIGGRSSKFIYKFDPETKEMEEFKSLETDELIVSKVNGRVYTIIDYHIGEINFKNRTINYIGYMPKNLYNYKIVSVDDDLYGFSVNGNKKYIVKITGLSKEDIEKPEIIVKGVENNSTVSTKKLPITVCITDNKDEDIIPVIKCNEKELDSSILNKVDGKYNLTLDLKDGQNNIEISAIDKAGNIEVKRYRIICKENIVPNKIVIEGFKERLHPKDKITLKSKVLDEQNNVIPSQKVIFTSSDEKVATIDEKTGEVTAIGNGTVILTAQLKDNKDIKESVKITVTDKYKVYVRVEGYDHTVLPRTEIEVGLFDLSPYLGKASGSSAIKSSGWGKDKFDRPSNAHAIVKALIDAGFKQQKDKVNKENKLFDFQDYGWSLYIAMIDGDREFNHDGMSGWLFRVNDALPSVGCASVPLNDGDDIVWMYSPYGFDNIYTKIYAEETDVAINNKINIKLNGYTGGYQKVSETVGRATILVNGKPYKINGQEVVTDVRGNAILTFDKPGDYTISAIRKDHKGLIDIIRPNPIVIHVTDGKVNKKSKIFVSGISNGDTVNVSDVNFAVEAVDKDGEKLSPIVKCNDELLLGKDKDYKAILKEGNNIISVVAEDKDKNIIKKIIEITCITKKSTLPKIKVEGIKGGTVDKAKAIFTVEAIDNNDGKIQPIVKLNNKEVLPKQDKQYEITLNEGSNIITIEAINKLGNVGREEFRINYKKNLEENLYTKILTSLNKVNSFTKANNTYSGDWKMVCLKQMGEFIPSEYLTDKEAVVKDYFKNISKTTKEKVTDYERMVIGIVAAGGDPTNIGGYNLIEKIYNFEGYKKDENSKPRGLNFQGINGVIYGLIALDTNKYNVPKNAKYTREWMLDYILENINNDGGWDLNMNGIRSDVDITSMTLIALAPYHNYVSESGKSVKKAVENAAKWLSEKQRHDGGYDSWGSENNSESCSQTIIGLCANGIDPAGTQFTKELNLVESLLKFQQPNGEFYHLLNGGQGVNGMATEQAFQALLAYKKFVDMGSKYCNGKNSIYNFKKVTAEGSNDNTEMPKIEVVGLKDGQEVNKSEMSFSVKVTDSLGKDIIPLVKLNGKSVNIIDGKCNVILKNGQNTIMIEAVDKLGNKSSISYSINYKVVEIKALENINIKKGKNNEVKIKVENITNKDKEVTFLAVLYDKKTLEMKEFKTIKKQIKVGTSEDFIKKIYIPQEGKYIIKIIFCDDLTPNKMNILAEPVIKEIV